MKVLVIFLTLLLWAKLAEANVCYEDSYGKVSNTALEILADFENTKRGVDSLRRNHIFAQVDFEKGYHELSAKLEEASTSIEKTRLIQEQRNLIFDFCFQEVFDTENKLLEAKDKLSRIDNDHISKTIGNLNTWSSWCSREGKSHISQLLNGLVVDLRNYRDIESSQVATQIDFEIKKIDFLDTCKAIYR